MSKKKKYIRKLAAKLWMKSELKPTAPVAIKMAEMFASGLEEMGYFDPEPKPEPAPEEMGPWRVANWEELPENGAEIEIKDVNFVHHSKYYFCLSEKMCKKQNEKYHQVKWGTLVKYKAEWRYA